MGNLTSVTDANGNTTRYTYDDFGRVIKTTNALGNTSEVTYDESGNVLTSTDFGGNLTTYTYDNLDRVSSKTTPDGTVSYTYTADGKLSTVTDSTGTTTFTYNNMDGLTRVDYPDGNYVSYKYDKSNRLTKVSTAFGDTAYQYDALDRITRVVDRNGYATVYEYDANGNRTAVKYANGLTVSYEYDKLNRLICEETIDSDSNVVVKYVYTLGASGERLSVTELDRTVEYTYDELYRLTSETITKGKTKTTYAYEYDNVSNRTLKNVDGVETVYTYNALNQLVSENDTTYEYDLNGNLVRVIGVGKSSLYEYNSENKLIKATVQQGDNVVVETYTYDYAGNRTSKTTTINNHVEKVYYLNDNSSLTNVLAEYSASGDEICYYTVGADLVSQEINGKVYVYLYDGHGTVRALANENGKVTDTYCYDAFGNLISSTSSTANSYRYCGEQFDSTTGLYYLRARYMNPSVGRFISMDTYQGSNADPISLHKYLYANSNPVMYSDPSGYMSLGEVMCVSAIIGGTCGAFINVAGYLDKLVGWRSFNLSDMVQAAFEGFLDGMVVGLLFGVAFAGISYLCTVIPILSGLDTALGYAFGTYGVAKAISDGSIEAGKGNYFTASIYSIIAAISGATLLNSIYTNAHANDIGNVANNSSSATGEKSSIPTQNQTELPQNVQDSYNAYKKAGWKNHSAQTPGTKAGKTFSNKNNMLPNVDINGNKIVYKEYDVNNYIPGSMRDSERFVVGSDGSVYYTDSHYGDHTSPTGLPPFIRIGK